MSNSSDVVVGSHHQDGIVYMSVKLPGGVDVEAARLRLASLSWALDIRRRGAQSGRTLLIEPNTPTANTRQLERRAAAIADALFGLGGFNGNITIAPTGN